MMYKKVALATAFAAVFAFGTTTAQAQNTCSAGKLKLAGKKASAILKCYAKASAKAIPVDALCVGKAVANFDIKSQKIDAKQDPLKPKTVCPAGGGDEVIVGPDIGAHVDDIATDLDPLLPSATTAASKCTAGKLKCAGKKINAVLKCYAKAAATNLPVATDCLNKAEAKFAGGGVGCYDKLEAKEVPAKSPPTNVCVAADGDAGVIGSKIGRWANHANAYLRSSGAATCPTMLTFTPTSTTGVLDFGWTGYEHDQLFISDATLTFAVSSCTGDGTAPACGTCTFTGPSENGPGQLHMRRCLIDTAIQCVSDNDCPIGPCVAHYGTYLPFGGAGVNTCLENTFNGTVTGTMDVGTGEWDETASVTFRVFSQVTLASPCPQCIGDAVANDGIQGGTCSAGLHAGAPCDVSGASPDAFFGTTSLDCPPSPAALFVEVPVDLSSTTGTKSRTLSALNPLCRGSGWNTGTECGGGPCRCQCDTCDNPAATPCSSDVDCGVKQCGGGENELVPCSTDSECPASTCEGGTTCGGKRCVISGQAPPNGAPCTSNAECGNKCVGGVNDGAACTLDSECPGAFCLTGGCVRQGEATRGNKCDGGPGDCLGGVCQTGLLLFCSNETFRECTNDTQCPGGGLCNVGLLHKCYDNGLVGDSANATGVPDAPAGHAADPTLASLFCMGPTVSSAANIVAGLPGLGRLELQGHATDNGTP